MIRRSFVDQFRLNNMDSDSFNTFLEKLKSLEDKSRIFLDPDEGGNRINPPFPEILAASNYIISRRWVSFTPPQPHPSSTQELRDRIRFLNTIPDLFTQGIRYPFAAFLHSILSVGFSEGLRLFWLFIAHLSLVNIAYEMRGRGGLSLDQWTSENIQEFLSTQFGDDRCVIQETYRPLINNLLTLLSSYWEVSRFPSSPLPPFSQEPIFVVPPEAVSQLSPRIYGSGCKEAIIRLRVILPVYWKDDLDLFGKMFFNKHILIFSGGYSCPVQMFGVPVKVPSPDMLPALGSDYEYYAFKVKSIDPVKESELDPGSLNFLDPQIFQSVREFLTSVNSQLSVKSKRFWIPWDNSELNFLWLGKPIIDYSVSNWLMVGQSGIENIDQQPYRSKLEVWGVENLNVITDGTVDNNNSGNVRLNHAIFSLLLPRDMKKFIEPEHYPPPDSEGILWGGYWYYMPRRYPIKIEASNSCGIVKQTYETGVTYPLKARFVGADFGQTISVESISPYNVLCYSPSFYNPDWGPDIYPASVPFSNHKYTFIRVLAEHNAPVPYLWTNESSTPCKPVINFPAKLRYKIKEVATNRVVEGPITRYLSGPDAYFYSKGLTHDGVLSITEPPTSISVLNYENNLRKRGSYSNRIFTFPFLAAKPGTAYIFEGELDFYRQVKIDFGVLSGPERFSFRFVTPNEGGRKLLFHWVRVLPAGRVTGEPVSMNELFQLEDWLESFAPSVDFEFSRNDVITLKKKHDKDDLWDKMEEIRGNRRGIFMAVISDAIWPQLDSSITEGVSGRAHYHNNVAYVHMTSPGGSVSTVAHEMGHLLDYDHIDTGNDEHDPVQIPQRYIKPGGDLYPYGSCGSFLLKPGDFYGSPNPFVLIVQSPEQNRDVMSYSSQTGFELIKCEELLYRQNDLYSSRHDGE